MSKVKYQRLNSGQLLLEVLISIGGVAIIAAVTAQLIFVSMAGNKISGETNAALGLTEEIFEAARSATTEKWQNIYNLDKNSASYHVGRVNGSWVIAAGNEEVLINGITYVRYFTVQNVCRDQSGNVLGITDNNGIADTCALNGGNSDPSTQKINVSVNWPDSDGISLSEYLTRWRNKVCVQSSWSTSGSGTSTCPTSVYESKNDISTGDTLQLCSGGC